MIEREQRFVFGEVAELYHRRRPPYPPQVPDRVAELAGEGARVVEIGAGTGKLTEPLATRGLSVTALEPSPEMAAVLRRNVAAWPAVEVVERSFEDWVERSPPADVLVAAQSWHWVDPAHRAGLAHRALRPGGWLVLAWSREEHGGPLGEEIDAAYERCAPELVDAGGWHATGPADELQGDPDRFSDVTWTEVRWQLRRRRDEYLELLETHSPHRMLEPAQLSRLLDAVGTAIDRHGGTITLDVRTAIVTARRR